MSIHIAKTIPLIPYLKAQGNFVANRLFDEAGLGFIEQNSSHIGAPSFPSAELLFIYSK